MQFNESQDNLFIKSPLFRRNLKLLALKELFLQRKYFYLWKLKLGKRVDITGKFNWAEDVEENPYTICSHCNCVVDVSNLDSHNDYHYKETFRMHLEFNDVILSDENSLKVENCALLNHALCPQDPPGSCAIDSLKTILPIANCNFLNVLGSRYWSGWYNSLDINTVLDTLNYSLFVEQNGRLTLISKKQKTKSVVMVLESQCHWSSARFKCISIFTAVMSKLFIIKLFNKFLLKKLLKFCFIAKRYASRKLSLRFAEQSMNERRFTEIVPTHSDVGVDHRHVFSQEISDLDKISVAANSMQNENNSNLNDDNNSEPEGNSSVEEQYDESDESNDDSVDFEFAEETIEESVCCFVPAITSDNFNTVVRCFEQFKGTEPNSLCLFNLLKISKMYFGLMDQMSSFSNDCIYFIKQYLKFRHNIFSYLFTNNVIKTSDLFDNEKIITIADSNRTPDLFIVKEQPKQVDIYEFTVVMNPLTANFMKGTNDSNSKYKLEIDNLKNKNYIVNYYPIFFSISSSLEQNIKHWESMGFTIDEKAINIFSDFSSNLEIDHSHMFGLAFSELSSKEYPLAKNFQDDLEYKQDNWYFKILKVNKSIFEKVDQVLKTSNLTVGCFLSVRKAKGNVWTTEQGFKTDNNFTVDQLKEMQSDPYFIYKYLNKFVAGNSRHMIMTKKLFELPDIQVDHGKVVEDVRKDSTVTMKNFRKLNLYTKEECLLLESKLQKIEAQKGTGLMSTHDDKTIHQALDDYRAQLDNKYSTDQVNSQVIISPRRSFVFFIDPSLSHELHYSKGVNLRTIYIEDVKSNVAKSIYSRLGHYKFDVENKQNPQSDQLKELYKQSIAQFYSFIGKEHSRSKLSNVRLIISDKGKFDELYKEMKSARLKYMSSLDINSYSGLKMTNTEKELFKSETDWSSPHGYKLYQGKINNILDLFDLLKIRTRSIHINLETPTNDFEANYLRFLKEDSIQELKSCTEELTGTVAFNNCVFMSRLAYTLMSLSHQNFNSSYMKVDNLGLTDCYLLVKGGKKITTTRKTKIFKLIYPTFNTIANWNNSVSISGQNAFDETPWMQLRQEVLFDMLSAPYKLLMNYVYLRETHNPDESLEIISLPLLLMFHNRRKTEIALHNMRYLCANSISEFSNLQLLIPEFANPTYSPFDHAIYRGFGEKFLEYYISVRKWTKNRNNSRLSFIDSPVKHPYLNRNIVSIVDFTYVIYSTFMMSKGQFDQQLEQIGNLKSIMETHSEYINSNNTGVYELENMWDNDFGFNKQTCYTVGKVLACYLRDNNSVTRLSVKWLNIMNEPIDTMANNKGLRLNGKEFFGHKGYYVIYKQLLEKNWDEINNLLNNEDDELKLYKKLRLMNQTFKVEQSSVNLEKVVMHVVDKVQRGGSREIYVMDYTTKLYQNPLEKMFKEICSNIENEIITVPSHKRASLIHRKCFEYSSEKYKTYYLTLDCKKWAPRSNPDKFLYMILGMQDVLPSDFVNAVIEYFQVHKFKEIHTRKEIYDKFIKNKDMELKFAKYFKIDEEKKSAYFIMPYSFVMGIFNMLSSLLHAGAQLYAKNVIERRILKKGKLIDFDMFAHSDDSGGRISIQADKFLTSDLISSVKTYETIMKACNHMMSLKKCSIGQTYFELISILYLNDELLPLLPKFLGNTAITFSGQGLSVDMKQVISKSIELLQNGSSNSTAYKCQIIMSNMYRNFYRVQTDTQLPTLGGFCNSWPALYLGYGAAVDEVRCLLYNNEFYKKFISFAIQNLNFDSIDSTLSLKYRNILRMPQAYRSLKNKYKLPEFADSQWFFENNKTRHSMLNMYWFIAKLTSNSFCTSLLNINEIKRAFDSLYFASGKNILGKTEFYSIESLILSIFEHEASDTDYESVIRIMFAGLCKFYNFLNTLNNPTIRSSEQLTTKPCSLSIQNFTDTPIKDYNSLNLSCQLVRPELLKYTYTTIKYGSELETMRNYLLNLGVPNDLIIMKNFLDHIKSYNNATIYYYSSIPTNKRHLHGYNGIMNLIKNNYHSQKDISKSTPDYLEKTSLLTYSNMKLKLCVLLFYFYVVYKNLKDNTIAEISISKKITDGEECKLPMAKYAIDKYIPYPTTIPFLDLIENQETKPIVLSNLTNWCIWTKKQGRLGEDWIGFGEFLISLDHNIYLFKILNKKITEVQYNNDSHSAFTECSHQYFSLLLQELNLDFLDTITPDPTRKYFSLNNGGKLGLHSGIEAAVGVQTTIFNAHMDLGFTNLTMSHSFNNGKHYVLYKGINTRLNTLDEIIFKNNKNDMFDTVDWDAVSDYSKFYFFKFLTRGDWGDLPNVEFDRTELLNNFTNTELYSMIYTQKKLKNNISQVMWDDLLSNMSYNEDVFPTLFENLGLDDLQKILPKTKKDNLALYLYYDTMNEDLRTVRYKINKLETEEDRIKYLTEVVLKLNDQYGMITLPEIGDIEEFKKFKFTKLDAISWVTVAVVLLESMYDGYLHLSDIAKRNLYRSYKFAPKNLFEIKFNFFKEQCKGIYTISAYVALTNFTMALHELLEEIHNEKMAFAEFARSFRGTILKNCPRHVYYLEEWHSLLANTIQYFHHVNFEPHINYLPADIFRALKTVKYNDYERFEVTQEHYKYTPLCPILLKIQCNLQNIAFDVEIKDVKFADLDVIDTRRNSQLNQKNLFIDFLDDELSIEPKYKRKKPSEDVIFLPNVGSLISWANSNFSNQNKAIMTNIFFENIPCKTVEVEDSRGNTDVLFIYNHINSCFNSDLNKRYKKFIGYYLETQHISLPFEVDIQKKEVSLDLSKSVKPNIIENNYEVTSKLSYNNELLEFLIKEFKPNDEVKKKIETIITSSLSPIGKFRNIKLLLQSTSEEKKEFDFKEVVRKVFDKQKKQGTVRMSGQTVKYQISKTTRNPDNIIIRATNNKVEFKQGNCILKNKWGKLLTETLVIKKSDLENLKSSFRLLRMNLRSKKCSNQAAVCTFMIDVLDHASVGQPNNDATIFIEEMRDLITELNNFVLVDDDEEELELPGNLKTNWPLVWRNR
jgi:hypothetical protein